MSRLPLPQGHKSLRPSFSSSSLSPCTMRVPRLTLVSDGNPLRRLLMGSKKRLSVEWLTGYGAPPFNVCSSIHISRHSVPARIRTWSTTFAESRASVTLRGQIAEDSNKRHVLYGVPPTHRLPLFRCQNVRSPHNGLRLLAFRCRKPPTEPQADTCPASPSSVPSTGR